MQLSTSRRRTSSWPVALTLVLALALTLVVGACGGPPAEAPPPTAEGEAPDPDRLILLARQALASAPPPPDPDPAAPPPVVEPAEPSEPGATTVLLSLTRGLRPAVVVRGEGDDLASALASAAAALRLRASQDEIQTGRLKVDLVTDRREMVDRGSWATDRGLDGLWLPDRRLLLLPGEVLARRLVIKDGSLAEGRLVEYLRQGGRAATAPVAGGEESRAPSTVRFVSVYEGAPGSGVELYRGNPAHPDLSPSALLAAARAGGDYLLHHQHEDGHFDSAYEVKQNAVTLGYHPRRHAEACLVLLRLAERGAGVRFEEAALRGLGYLLRHTRGPRPEEADLEFEAVAGVTGEGRVGATASAVLALLEYQRITGEEMFLPRARRLGRFLLHQQTSEGEVKHRYFYGLPDPRPLVAGGASERVIVAFLRLHAVDPEGPWLNAAERGIGWLLGVRDLGKSFDELPQDPWLLAALDEMHAITGGGRTFYLHGRRAAEGILRAQRMETPYPDWEGAFGDPPRVGPTAERIAALATMARIARRAEVGDSLYVEGARRALPFLLRCQLTEANTLYLLQPERALGGFRDNLYHWDVTLEDMTASLDALLGFLSHGESGPG